MQVMDKLKKNDFVEIKYTGYVNENVFDSNIEEDLKKLDPKSDAKPKKTIVSIGNRMLVIGLDNALEEKEIGKDYEVEVKAKEGFGERQRELVKTIPLKVFREKSIDPRPGMVLNIDNSLARIITISGARVITDFNHPLAGKNLKYKFKIERKVEDIKEKTESFFENTLQFKPEFEIKEKTVVVKGPKILGQIVETIKNKFKELVSADLGFEEKKPETKKEEHKAK